MKLKNVAVLIVVFLAAVLLAACTPQDEGDQATNTPDVPVVETELATEPAATETQLTATPAIDETPSAAEPMAALASDLIGAPIEDAAGQAIGEVQDLLMTEAGAIQYLVLDYDDPASGESRVVAVAWTQVEVQSASSADAEFAPVLVVNADALSATQEVNLDLLDINEVGDDDDANDGTDDAPPALAAEFEGLVRVGQFTEFNLRNEAGEDLGEVEDLAIDLQSHQVIYAIADVGGFLGLGERTVAIPWDQIRLERTEDEVAFVVPVEVEVLENAPEIDLVTWPDPTAVEWDAEVSGYWETLID